MLSARDYSIPENATLRPESPELYFDRTSVLAALGGDESLLAEILRLFLEESQKHMTEIRAALAAHQPDKLTRAAHSLKGNVGVFGVQHIIDAALRLELIGRAGDLGDAEFAFRELNVHVEKLMHAIRAEAVRETQFAACSGASFSAPPSEPLSQFLSTLP